MADTDCAITEAPETPSEDSQCVEAQQSNVESVTMDEETKEKLKGDQIGDTMYNQSFVIKTLMRFSNPKVIQDIWDEELENDMCFLWDMTIEPVVGQFLFELGYPSIACAILQAEVPHRLTEILIGILGNICTPMVASTLDPLHLDIVLHHFETNDHLILVQLMRLVKVIAFKSNDCNFITEDIMDKIIFILFNSMNVALLEATLGAVDKLTSDKKLAYRNLNEHLLESSFSAFKVIYDSENDSDSSEPYKTEIVKRNLTHLLQILVNLSVYCNDDDVSSTTQVKIIRSKVKEHEEVIFNELLEVMKNYTDEYDVNDEIAFLVSAIDFIFPIFNLHSDKLTLNLITLADSLRKHCSNDTSDNFLSLVKCQLLQLTINDELRQIILATECLSAERLRSNIIHLKESFSDAENENIPVLNVLTNLEAILN